jgi:hypothetical protein
MSDIDNLLHKYATEGAGIEARGTNAGYYTYYGLLGKFLLEVMPLISETDKPVVPNDASRIAAKAEEIVYENSPLYIQAVKHMRNWLYENKLNTDHTLKDAKDACDAARERLVNAGKLFEAKNTDPSGYFASGMSSYFRSPPPTS